MTFVARLLDFIHATKEEYKAEYKGHEGFYYFTL